MANHIFFNEDPFRYFVYYVVCYLLEYSFIHAKCIHLIKSWVYTFLPSVNIHHIYFYSLRVYIIYILPSVGIHYIHLPSVSIHYVHFTPCEYTLYTFALCKCIIYILTLCEYTLYTFLTLCEHTLYTFFALHELLFFFHFLHTGFRKKVLNFGKVESFHCLFNGCCFWPVCLLREDLMCLRLASDSLHS